MKILAKVNIKRLWDNRLGTGLALSGGGAKGFAHLGTLLAMERFGLKPDIMSGVSAGAIVATLYSSGLAVTDIIECFAAYNGFNDFTNLTVPRTSLFKLDKFARIFESWLPVKYMEELNIPTIVCATDLVSGKCKGWHKGEITPRVMASCSMPIIFTPVEIDGVQYVDGGVLRNLPAWVIRKHCRTLIGSNCSPLPQSYCYKPSILSLALRSYTLMSKSNTLQDILLCDTVIRHTSVAGMNTFNMSEMKNIVVAGYDTASPIIENMLK